MMNSQVLTMSQEGVSRFSFGWEWARWPAAYGFGNRKPACEKYDFFTPSVGC